MLTYAASRERVAGKLLRQLEDSAAASRSLVSNLLDNTHTHTHHVVYEYGFGRDREREQSAAGAAGVAGAAGAAHKNARHSCCLPEYCLNSALKEQ